MSTKGISVLELEALGKPESIEEPALLRHL